MDFCIKNNRNIYIKLDEKGTPVTCVKSVRGIFEYSKAKNILNSLPKTLRRMNFKVEAIPEVKQKGKVLEDDDENKESYVVSKDITQWVDKFGRCSDVFDEAMTRKSELIELLRKSDNEFLDILHIIEIEKPKDMYGGWKCYKRIKEIREKRRKFKDELLIIENVLREINPNCVNRERIQRAIDGLFGRKYSFRVVEEEDANAVL